MQQAAGLFQASGERGVESGKMADAVFALQLDSCAGPGLLERAGEQKEAEGVLLLVQV